MRLRAPRPQRRRATQSPTVMQHGTTSERCWQAIQVPPAAMALSNSVCRQDHKLMGMQLPMWFSRPHTHAHSAQRAFEPPKLCGRATSLKYEQRFWHLPVSARIRKGPVHWRALAASGCTQQVPRRPRQALAHRQGCHRARRVRHKPLHRTRHASHLVFCRVREAHALADCDSV